VDLVLLELGAGVWSGHPASGCSSARRGRAELAADRRDLSGPAVADDVPWYVPAASRSGTIDGWRARRFNDGIDISVQPGEIVTGDLP
jgi:hypothetical protein